MTVITYLKEVPTTKKFFAVVLFLFGLYILITNNILVGGIALVIGINLMLTEGAEIDLTNMNCRNVKSILGFKVGSWKPCPEFEYISVFKTTENQTVNVVSATTTFTNDVIMVNLFYDRNKHFTFYKTDDKADAFDVAQHFKLALDIDILDATGQEKVWL